MTVIASLLIAGLSAWGASAQSAKSTPGAGADGFAAFDNFPDFATAVPAAPNVVRRNINVSMGRSVVLDLPAAAREAFVADPKVAAATVQTARKLYVTGVGHGTTTIIASNSQGQQLALIEVSVNRDTGSLESALQAALPQARITVRYSGPNVVLTGPVHSSLEAAQAIDIASGFLEDGGKVVNALSLRSKDQVMLRVVVAEVQRNVLKQLGVQASGEWNIGNATVSALMNNPYGVAGQALTNSFLTAGDQDGTVTLQAMEQAGVARTLAEPNISAISGETATFFAGGEIPIPTGITCQSNNVCQPSIEFKNFGVSLTFTPVVLNGGRISMRVATEVSEVDPNNKLTVPVSGSQNFTVPGFRKRRSDTTVELPSGGTLVAAGLIQDNGRQAITGIPGAAEVPILGALFRSRDYQRQETELVIAVTPLLSKPVPMNSVARPTNGFVDSNDAQAVGLGQVNRVSGRNTPGVRAEASAPLAPNAPPPPPAYYGHVGFIVD